MKAIIAVPATLALVYRAYSRKSLTPGGLVAAALTAAAHAAHPWSLPFALLCAFFLAGTRATAVKKDVKAGLTLHSASGGGGEGPRTAVQVLANSAVATALTLLHAWQLRRRRDAVLAAASEMQQAPAGAGGSFCFRWAGDLLVVGIIANYAAVCADTLSSELGILSRSSPRLITSPTLRRVPRGTNGGVTLWGLAAGLFGSVVIVSASLVTLPFCNAHTTGKVGGGADWTPGQRVAFTWAMAAWGALGSLLDSLLGGWLQRSVRDVPSGKIVEGEGGVRVIASTDADPNSLVNFRKSAGAKARLVRGGEGKEEEDAVEEEPQGSSSAVDGSAPGGSSPYDPKDKQRASSFGDKKPTRVAESGIDLLDNNQVNFLMAFIMSTGAMVAAGWYWDVPLSSILQA
ncbi:integral membrane protein DUF92 [Xylariaceae sp. FL0804]|nr:integral membrane protein DUF92 [Xylariaceae sp. FL0804]